jgi:hypothetical protein
VADDEQQDKDLAKFFEATLKWSAAAAPLLGSEAQAKLSAAGC